MIFIEKVPGKRIALEVEPSDTIAVVKDKFMSKHDLIYYGKELHSNKLLSDYMVKNQSTLHLVSKVDNRDLIIYLISSYSGDRFTVVAKASKTVLDLKKKVAEKRGEYVNQQRLLFSGELMKNNYSNLSVCGIKMYSEIHFSMI